MSWPRPVGSPCGHTSPGRLLPLRAGSWDPRSIAPAWAQQFPTHQQWVRQPLRAKRQIAIAEAAVAHAALVQHADGGRPGQGLACRSLPGPRTRAASLRCSRKTRTSRPGRGAQSRGSWGWQLPARAASRGSPAGPRSGVLGGVVNQTEPATAHTLGGDDSPSTAHHGAWRRLWRRPG